MKTTPAGRHSRGFSLLEVMLATALFAMAALALSGALNQVGLLALESAEATRGSQLIYSRVIELSRAPDLRTGVEQVDVPGSSLMLESTVEEFRATNEKGENLDQLFRIQVRLLEKEGPRAGQVLGKMETYRYGPFYRG